MDYKYTQWDEVTDDDIKPGARLYRSVGKVTFVCIVGMNDDYAVYAEWSELPLDITANYGTKIDNL